MRRLAALISLALLTGCGHAAHLTAPQIKAVGASAARAGMPLGSTNGLRSAGQRIADAFMAADDRDHDGRLSAAEFSGYNLAQFKVSLTSAAIDTNHDGFVSAAELAASLQSPTFVQACQTWWYQDFKHFDLDKNDQLARPEFDQMLKTSGLAKYMTVSNFFDADKNGDGSLNPSEYEDLGFGTYVDFVLVPFLQGGGRDALGNVSQPGMPLLLPAIQL